MRFGCLIAILGILLTASELAYPKTASAAPLFKQATSNEINSGTVNNVTFASANTGGDLIVAHVLWSNAGAVTLTDSRGNGYTAGTARSAWGAGWSEQILYAKNIAAGPNTVTATFATAINSFAIVQIHEYAGIDKVNPFDGASRGSGAGTAMNSGSVTTTNANDLLFAGGGSNGSMGTIGSGWTMRLNSAGNKSMDRSVTAAGTYSATANHSGGDWTMHLIAFKTDPGGPADTTPPSAPGSPSATPTSPSQINLAWTASTDNVGVTGYQVDRCQGGTCANFALVTTVTATSFADTGRTAATTYRYRIRATDAAGNLSPYSAIVTATTQGVTDTTPPSVPTNLAVQAVSSTQLTISWTASTDNVGVTGYHVFRDGTLLTTTAVTPIQDAGLTPSTTYGYRVSAFDAAGNESAQTAAVPGTTPAPDSTPPSAAMTAPAPGSTVAGVVTVSATASDNVAVADVEFLLDGVSIGVDASAPYSVQWTTTTTSNGPHNLSARARDTAGNFGLTSGVVTVTVNNPALPAGLVAAWNFNEGSGSTATDVTGNGNTATLRNSPLWTAGKYGTGVRLGGAGQYLSVANSPTINIAGAALTFSAWVNPVGGGGDQVLFGKFYNATMSSPYYQFGIELAGGTSPTFYIGTASGLAGASMGSALPAGQWSHLAVVFAGNQVRFYRNGTLVSSPSISASIVARTSPMHLGADVSPGQYFNGSLDDVRLYNRTQTQAEVAADQNTPLPSPSGNPGAPTVSITSPAPNAQVTGIITITANAGDDVGVTGVQFYVDGSPIGPEDTTAPYGANWDTRAFGNGAHTLTASARDTSGNTTVSTPVVANVANGDNFLNEILATGLDLPTAMKFLPDGRMLVAELQGKIRILPPPYTTPDPSPFLQIANIGTSGVQQGVYDFALDPDFTTNRYYYVFYTAATPNEDRLSRFTANASATGTVPGSELMLYVDPQGTSPEHHGGAITFANDGKILFTAGEHFIAENAQNLNNPRGKIHRINRDGTVPTDNPFYDGAGPHWDSIWAYGLRNPFRAFYDAPTGRMFVGDVGGNVGSSNEEINLGVAGGNYGWADSEGQCAAPCRSPIYDYEHNNRDAAVVAGFVYRGSQFPAGMQGNFFFADYAQNWIKRMTFDTNGNVSGVFNFEPTDGHADGPTGDVVYLTQGPDGALYYLDLGYSDVTGTFGVSKVRRIRYQSANLAPIAVAAANPTSGPVPLSVSFSSAGSSDPEGQPITYSWDFGDGTLSTAANPTHTFTQAGQYTVRLTVSDGVSSTFSTPIPISAGSPPTASITGPADGLTFRAGDVIAYSGDAVDPDDGTLPASAFRWSIDFLHDGHVHPGPVVTGVKSGNLTIPTSGHDFSGNTRYRITLTVTDSAGLTDTKTVTVFPVKVNLSFGTMPAGLTLYLDGIAKTTPFTYDTLVGFNHTVEARNQTVGSTAYTFASWSDGGGQLHTITVPAGAASYAATFTGAPATNGPAAAWGFAEGSGTSAADATGNGNTATLAGGAAWVAGRHGGGVSLDGVDDYLSMANTSTLNISGNALALSMWINPGSVTGDSMLLGKFWNTTMSSPYYQYGVELSGGTPHFYVGTAGGLQGAAMSAPLALNTWSHLAIVFNGTQVQFYVNGTLANTVAMAATITARGNPMRVGADANTGQFFRGVLDDVRVYNRVLSASEVLDNLNTGV